MSLINQMLKDLEQRGAGPNDAGKINATNLNSALKSGLVSPVTQGYTAKQGIPVLKISGLMVLLAGGAYLWVQSLPALSHSIDHRNELPKNNPTQVAKNQTTLENKTQLTPQNQTAESLQDLLPASLFENSLKYQPIVAESKNNQVQNTLEKKVVAKLMPIEIDSKNIAANKPMLENISVKPIELMPSIEAKPLTSNQASTEKMVNEKSAARSESNSNNIGKQMSQEQKSANLYRQALANLQQGRVAEAQANLGQSLEINPNNQEARQTLAGLLLDNNRNEEAKNTLAAGLAIAPEQTNFRIALARLQIESGDKSAALKTLEQGQAYANNNADYQSFLATMLQRANRHDEAISHYNTALSINSGAANAWVGLGISQMALGKLQNAQDSFARAQSSEMLSPEMTQFTDQQLKQIKQQLQN